MCHGGWCFADLTEQLRGHGHLVHPLTLTGIGERGHLLHGGVNLDTHIEDVTALLAAENIHGAVLVGHSYGGMVITGTADRMPERVDSLVYIDAVVPAHGDSCWALVSDQERRWYLDVEDSGYATRPLPFFDLRATPHPKRHRMGRRITLHARLPASERRPHMDHARTRRRTQPHAGRSQRPAGNAARHRPAVACGQDVTTVPRMPALRSHAMMRSRAFAGNGGGVLPSP
jgi:pimeloyl-ACP methyl ester carboxylesterase